MAAVTLPGVQITLKGPSGVLKLNGVGADSAADQVTWSNAVNGGHVSASFRIDAGFYASHKTVIDYGTRCEFKIAPGFPDAGATIFTGYLIRPASVSTPDITINVVGYQQLVSERNDPMLWQSAHIADWVSTNSSPFGSNFHCSNGIQESINPGHAGFIVANNATVPIGDVSSIGFWFGPDVNVTRIAGTITKNNAMPGGVGNWRLVHARYDGPTAYPSRVVVNDLSSALGTGNQQDTFVSVAAAQRPVATIELIHIAGSVTTNAGRFWIADLRVNGDAYRGGRTPADTYQGHNPILDLAVDLGFTTGKVSAIATSCLPLWQQNGPWTDVFEHLSNLFTGANGWKWGIWDIVGGAPEIEFRDYATSNTTWTVNAYGSTANAIANLQSAQQDLFAKVVVSYRHAGSPRVLRVAAGVFPNPFAGLDPWMANRQRTFHYHIPDPQPAGSTLPATVASNLAADYSNEQWDGTVMLSYANDGSTDRSAFNIRAGQLLRIADFPGGAKTFRIEGVDGSDVGPVTITIGRRPHSIERMIWKQHERFRRRALHHIHA